MREQDSSPSVAFHPSAARRALLFGPFRFDLADKTLSRDGDEIRLPPRALAILDYLIERPGRIVAKQELIDAVWKEAFVGESSLTEAIGVLRQALGDSAEKAEFIQTVHRRGYRFVAPLAVDAQASSSFLAPALPAPAPAPAPASTPATDAPAGGAPHIAPGARPRPSRRAAWLAMTACVLLAAAVAAWVWMSRATDAPVTRATITLPVEQAPAPGLTARPLIALSPDGRRVVYVAGAPGSYRLFMRAIDQFEAVPIPGTDGAWGPFFSPDGGAIGFFKGGRLFVMTLPAGQPLDLADGGAGEGGWWHHDGTITFATGRDEGLYQIDAHGGARRPILAAGLDGATLRTPMRMPDGRTVLATAWKVTVRHSGVVAIDTASGSVRTIARGVHPRLLPDGRVIYLRDGDLVAAPLDGLGPEVPLISGVMTGVTGAGQYALAANGTLIYLPDAPARLQRRLARITAGGREEALPFEPRPVQNAALSPDGTRVLVTMYERGASDLWMGDVSRGVFQRMTDSGGTIDPVWAPDSRTFYFAWTRPSGIHIHRMPADGSAPPAIVSTASPVSPASVLADGSLFAIALQPRGLADILTIGAGGEPQPWLATPAGESAAQLSPDERYLAYQSDKSGRLEVYVRPAHGGAPELQVSVNGGLRPGWLPDGSIVYSANRRLYRAAFDGTHLSRPVEIYANPRMMLARTSAAGTIAILAIEEERPLTTLNLVVNWASEARERR